MLCQLGECVEERIDKILDTAGTLAGPAGERRHSEADLAARARELDQIQTLGRRAAEAREPHELFHTTVSALAHSGQLDLLIVVHVIKGVPEQLIFQARPFDEACLEQLRHRAAKLFDWPPDEPACPQRIMLDGFDPAQSGRLAFSEEELIVFPILRRGAPLVYLLVVPAPHADEGQIRLLYSATNQISLHLDRILSSHEAEADRFRSILESMPQAVLMTDRSLRIVQANRSACALLEEFGVRVDDGLDGLLARLGLGEQAEQVLEHGAAISGDEIQIEQGKVFNVTITPQAGKGADAGGLVMVLADVTEVRRLQHSLSQSEKMSSLGQMISGVAHELNNPLATILGCSQLVTAIAHDDSLSEKMRVLQNEAERCREIVRNLLSFARSHEHSMCKIGMNEVIQSVVSLMGYQLRVNDVHLELDLDPDLPASLGDAHQLQQVLVNLFTNARQAITEHGDGGTIRVRTRPLAGDQVLLEVGDSGPGIPAAIRSNIFDPFFTTKPEGRGTGLGLSLVYGIVTSHGGTIELLPAETTGGAVFRITLPVTATDQPLADCGQQTEALPAGIRGRILVVDDEQPFGQLIAEALSRDGHDAETAGSGAEALALLTNGTFDLVISDSKMPGMSGERLLQEARLLKPELAGRFLLMTGDTFDADAVEPDQRRDCDILHKPFDFDLLRRLVMDRLSKQEGHEV
jgi:two-component system NtrC family sensor kinase